MDYSTSAGGGVGQSTGQNLWDHLPVFHSNSSVNDDGITVVGLTCLIRKKNCHGRRPPVRFTLQAWEMPGLRRCCARKCVHSAIFENSNVALRHCCAKHCRILETFDDFSHRKELLAHVLHPCGVPSVHHMPLQLSEEHSGVLCI